MFLTELLPEEKEAFLELAYLIAESDGKQSIYESSIIERYQKEMGLENYSIQGLAFEDILEKFNSDRTKNIVLTELLQLIYSDGIFQDQERESFHQIIEHFGLNPNEFNSFKDWIVKIKELSKLEEQ